MLKRILLLSCFLAPAAWGTPVFAQDISSPEGIALRNQILQLQAQVNALQSGQNGGQASPSAIPAPVASGGAAAPAGDSDLIAQLLSRVSNLEDQVRTLTGRIDELSNQLTEQNQQFTKQIGDINFQLQGGSGAVPGATPAPGAPAAANPFGNDNSQSNAAPPGAGPAAANGGLVSGTLGTLPADQTPPPAAAAAPSSQDTLQAGIEALGQRNYTAAADDAKAVLATDRDSPIGYDAQFLLARALAGKRDWEGAAVAYDDTFKRARFGSHSQDAQLGEARALVALGDAGAACGALNRLTKQYPNPREDLAPAIAKLRAKACAA